MLHITTILMAIVLTSQDLTDKAFLQSYKCDNDLSVDKFRCYNPNKPSK